MAVKIIANYSKRLGLPGYSSHQFSVSVETELTDLGQVQGEAIRLYDLLQESVDREIQQTGFVPDESYGKGNQQPAVPARQQQYDRSNNGHPRTGKRDAGNNGANGDHENNGNDQWACSDKQKELVLRLVDQNGLDRQVVNNTAMARFNKGVRSLNKLEMSGLIQEMLETFNTGSSQRKGGNGR